MQVNISDISEAAEAENDNAGGRPGSNGGGSLHGGPVVPVHAIMFTLLSGTV